MADDIKTETFRLFETFFKDKKIINYYSSYKNAEKVRVSRAADKNYTELGAMLLSDFESTRFGQKCLQMMVKYNCSFNFNPEAEHIVDGKRVPKRKSTKGEFVEGGPEGNFALNIYENNPELARLCIDHEAQHFVQRVKAEKTYGIMGLNNLTFDKYLMVNLVYEADAFARQAEEAYFNKEHPELFASTKKLYKSIAESYEEEFTKTNDKNKAYSKAFSTFFTSHEKETLYSKFYAEQYFNMDIPKRTNKRDINIAKFIQIITEKRFNNPDGFEKLVTDNFRFESYVWKKINEKYSKLSKYFEEVGTKEDLSYMKFSTSDNSVADDFSTVREAMDKFKLINDDKGNSEIDTMLKASRKKLEKTMQTYEENKISFTKGGDFAKALNDWIKAETLATERNPSKNALDGLIEITRFYDTLDTRKSKRDTHTILALQEKEKTFNRQNLAKEQLPLERIQAVYKSASM